MGMATSYGAAEGMGGTTHLLRHVFYLNPPQPGFLVIRARLEPWSDNKSEWWWNGKSILFDRQGPLGAIELFPEYVSRVGGRYVLAVQNSNDYGCTDSDSCNPQGIAFRLVVTWSFGAGSRIYLPIIARTARGW